MVLYICEKFHQNIWNGFQLTQRTRVHSRNGYFQYLLCSKGRNSKSRLTSVTFLCSTHCLTVLYICEKFHQNIWIGFQLTERTRVYSLNCWFNVQRALTPKIAKPVLLFMCSAHRLIVLYICVKFCENISNGFQLTERTRVHGRNGYVQCSKGNNFQSRQTRVTVHVFCTSPHSALHLCGLVKISQLVSELWSGHA